MGVLFAADPVSARPAMAAITRVPRTKPILSRFSELFINVAMLEIAVRSIDKMRASNVRFRVLQLPSISPNQCGKVKPAKL